MTERRFNQGSNATTSSNHLPPVLRQSVRSMNNRLYKIAGTPHWNDTLFAGSG